MRHANFKHRLNRSTSLRKATLRSLATSLLIYQSIRTTKAKAKAVQPLVDKLIGLAQKDSLFARRQSYAILGSHKLVKLLFSDIGPRFTDRNSGFSRVIGLGVRRGDDANLVLLELCEIKKKEKHKHPRKEKALPPKGEAIPIEKPAEEKKPKTETRVLEKPPEVKKPAKGFLGGIRQIFKKKGDSL
ncbi:MAG: 50S ribosomal protein L17 [Candidatus Omnitrophota bacterium]